MKTLHTMARRLIVTLLVLYVAVSAALLVTVLGVFRLTDTVNATTLQHEIGHAYYWPWPSTASMSIIGDTPEEPGHSRLDLYEDGRRLGPPHSQHADVRAQGQGRYSHWGSGVYFSASDNTDPRHNGRVYTVRYPVPAGRRAVHGWLLLTALTLAALARPAWRRRETLLRATAKVLTRARRNWDSFE